MIYSNPEIVGLTLKQILLITARTQLKSKLRQVLVHIKGFHVAASTSDLKEAREIVGTQPFFHYMFFGSDMPEAATAKFIADVKRKRGPDAEKTIFVLIFEGGEANQQRVASRMMAGFHGFLCEPFSFDTVKELTALAEGVSDQLTVTRLKVATGILLSDLKDEDVPSERTLPGAPVDLLQQANRSCKWYNKKTNESITLMVMSKLKGATLSDCWDSIKGFRDKVRQQKGAVEHLRVYFKNVFPPTRGKRER